MSAHTSGRSHKYNDFDMYLVRLENEHLGNMDQYRVTREVPLPYSFDDAGHESDADEDDHQSVSSWRRRKTQKPQTRENSRGDGERQPKE